MKASFVSYLLNIALLIGVIFSVQKCNDRKDVYEQNMTGMKSFYEGEINETKISRDLLVHAVDVQKQIVMSYRNEIAHLHKDFKDLKEHKALVKTEYISVASGVEIEYIRDTITKVEFDTTDLRNYIIKGSKLAYKDDWMIFNGTLSDKFIIDSVSMFNKFDLIIAEQRTENKIFNRWEPVVKVNSYSPYTSQVYMNNVVFEDGKKKKRNKIGKSITHILAFASGVIVANKTK